MKRHRFVVAIALLLLAGCGPRTGDLGGVATPPSSTAPSLDLPSAEPTPDGSPGGSAAASPGGEATTIRAYFFLGSFTGDSGLVPVLREVPHTQAVGAAAMAALLEGPNERELSASPAMYTDVPDGSRFLGLTIDNGVATVDLSQEFQAGGDSASINRRIAQVVYTLTQFPTLQAVRFEFDGAPPPTVFAGSFDRMAFVDLLPAIWVDRPAWGGVLGNPARVTGLANVFEAQFRIEILDAAGTSLTDQPAHATCGSGCWGTFDVTLTYAVPTAQSGTLRVYDRSPRDGSREHVVEYPVQLTP